MIHLSYRSAFFIEVILRVLHGSGPTRVCIWLGVLANVRVDCTDVEMGAAGRYPVVYFVNLDF